jgi:DNA-binding NtrC family response regulator
MPPENPVRQKGGGTGQPVDPPNLRSPGASRVDYPTVLVAHDDEDVRSTLVDCLQRSGFHVLEADDWAHVLYWVRVHSRPIHLVLADVSKAELMPKLKTHRPEMQVVFVKEPVDADEVLAKVRQILGSPTPPPSLPSIR